MRITALSRATDDSSPGYRREARRACERRDQGRTPRAAAARRAALLAGVLFGACIIVLGLGAVLDGQIAGLFASGADEGRYVEVTVKPGDTLWRLAREHGPQGRDIRETVDRIRTVNGLHQRAGLVPGERLLIPVR